MGFRVRDIDIMNREELIDYVHDLETRVAAADGIANEQGRLNLAKALNLTPTEATVLAHLASGKVCSKAHLLSLVYGGAYDTPGVKIVDVYIYKLRRKLAGTGIRIETIWGSGYFVPDPKKLRAVMAGGEVERGHEDEPPAIGRPSGSYVAKWGSVRDRALEYLRSVAGGGVVRVTANELTVALEQRALGAVVQRNFERSGHIAILEKPATRRPLKWTIVLSEGVE